MSQEIGLFASYAPILGVIVGILGIVVGILKARQSKLELEVGLAESANKMAKLHADYQEMISKSEVITWDDIEKGVLKLTSHVKHELKCKPQNVRMVAVPSGGLIVAEALRMMLTSEHDPDWDEVPIFNPGRRLTPGAEDAKFQKIFVAGDYSYLFSGFDSPEEKLVLVVHFIINTGTTVKCFEKAIRESCVESPEIRHISLMNHLPGGNRVDMGKKFYAPITSTAGSGLKLPWGYAYGKARRGITEG
ncbi:MAG: hypothetical protein AAF558_03010 [Verrucomicrobiota bacterium]